MYFNIETVKTSAHRLGSFHPFFGITFLVCKKEKLPVGKSVPFGINAAEEEFLRAHYKPDITNHLGPQAGLEGGCPVNTPTPDHRALALAGNYP